MLEPIADSVRATLDGHIVLSRSLAERNHYPAIDINLSVSRSMNDIIDERHRKLADTTRRLLRTWAEVSDLVAVGAYEAGGDPWVDAAVAVHHQLGAFLRQRIDERTDPAAALSRLGEIAAAAEAIAERG
jgi:flagellum-specific ATP synthase